MPTYDYVCDACGNRFEEWQKITDEPIALCPVCGGPVHRVIYPVGLVFKGGGFYKTDNRSASGDASATTTPAAASDGKDTAAKDTAAKGSETAGSESKASAGGSTTPAKGD
jgi:putative FmdB family regulatory protein